MIVYTGQTIVFSRMACTNIWFKLRNIDNTCDENIHTARCRYNAPNFSLTYSQKTPYSSPFITAPDFFVSNVLCMICIPHFLHNCFMLNCVKYPVGTAGRRISFSPSDVNSTMDRVGLLCDKSRIHVSLLQHNHAKSLWLLFQWDIPQKSI